VFGGGSADEAGTGLVGVRPALSGWRSRERLNPLQRGDEVAQ
jgi:hypothetical protein